MIIPASGGGGYEECTVFRGHPKYKFTDVEDKTVYVCLRGHFLGKGSDCKYCPACGAKVITKCPSCGEAIRNIPNVLTRYCASCGQAFPWVKEHEAESEPRVPN